jgi:hypothetical protein
MNNQNHIRHIRSHKKAAVAVAVAVGRKQKAEGNLIV